MDKIIGLILRGIPAALVMGVGLLLFVIPLKARLDGMETVIKHQVLPAVKELRIERLGLPEVKLIPIDRERTHAK